MSTAVLPSLAGLGFDIVRTPKWETTVQSNVSGLEVRIANNSTPRWEWSLAYNILRSVAAYNELQQLVGFFNARQGMFDTFLYQDADDHIVTGQGIAVGDGVTHQFQLVRSFGGYTEPVLAPNFSLSRTFYLNGVAQVSGFSVSQWGDVNPGQVFFTTPPANGVVITADFSYYWPVRMTADSVPFTMFMSQFYSAKKFGFISVKN